MAGPVRSLVWRNSRGWCPRWSASRCCDVRLRRPLSSLGSGDLDVVLGPPDVNAFTRALLGRVDDFEAQMSRHVDPAAGVHLQLTGRILHVGEAVDVEFEDLRRVLDAEPVTGAQ